MKQFVSDQAKQAFRGAIEDIEARSAAEVVVAIRHHSGSYAHADALTAFGFGVATLAVMLFAPWQFSTAALFIDPLVVGAVAALASTQLPEWRRWLTPMNARRARVRQAARATFYDKQVGQTSGRTGILVYFSLLERMAEVVPDAGVRDAVSDADWHRACAAVEAALRRGRDGVSVARSMSAIGVACEAPLPRAADDVNELSDEVHHP